MIDTVVDSVPLSSSNVFASYIVAPVVAEVDKGSQNIDICPSTRTHLDGKTTDSDVDLRT